MNCLIRVYISDSIVFNVTAPFNFGLYIVLLDKMTKRISYYYISVHFADFTRYFVSNKLMGCLEISFDVCARPLVKCVGRALNISLSR